jgi:hypothetical protein
VNPDDRPNFDEMLKKLRENGFPFFNDVGSDEIEDFISSVGDARTKYLEQLLFRGMLALPSFRML